MKNINKLLLFIFMVNAQILRPIIISNTYQASRSKLDEPSFVVEDSSRFNLFDFDRRNNHIFLATSEKGYGKNNIMISTIGRHDKLGLNPLGHAVAEKKIKKEKKDEKEKVKEKEEKEEIVQPILNKSIKKIIALPNGDMLVIPCKEENIVEKITNEDGSVEDKITEKINSKFYIIHNPDKLVTDLSAESAHNTAQAKVVTSPDLKNLDDQLSNIIDCAVVGSHEPLSYRIAVIVSGNSNHEDLRAESSPNKAVIRFVTFHGSYFDEKTTLLKIEDETLNLDTSVDGKDSLGSLSGIIKQGIDSLSMEYFPELKTLYLGIKTDKNKDSEFSGNNHSFLFKAIIDKDKISKITSVVPKLDSMPNHIFSINKPMMHYSIKNITPMISSKNAYYLVVSVDHSNSVADEKSLSLNHASKAIYCIPVFGEETSEENIGRILSSKNNITNRVKRIERIDEIESIILNEESMFEEPSSNIKTLVGGSFFPGDSRDMSNIKFVGDSIMLINDGTHLAEESIDDKDLQKQYLGTIGAWISHPIYNEEGLISGFSKWARAFPNTYNAKIESKAAIILKNAEEVRGTVYGSLGRLDGKVINRIASINWGLAKKIGKNIQDNNYPFQNNDLINTINSTFENNGVWASKSFLSNSTTGIAGSGLTAFSSGNKLILATTGGNISAGNSEGYNYPVNLKELSPLENTSISYLATDFKDTEKYFYSQEVESVGTILSFEFARVLPNQKKNNGLFFVSGSRGIAVMRKSSGEGFNPDSKATTFENMKHSFEGMSFKNIPGINEPVFEIISTDQFIYFMTKKNIFRIKLQEFQNDEDSSMFKDSMEVIILENDNDPELLKENNPSKIIIQKLFKDSSDEYFLNMLKIEGTNSIFLASTKNNTSYLYLIKDANKQFVFSKDPTKNIFLENTVDQSMDHLFKKRLPYYFRRMNAISLNSNNKNLKSGSATIANLYILSGSIENESSLFTYEVKGEYDSQTSKFYASQISLSPINRMVYKGDKFKMHNRHDIGVLANGISLAGVPFVFSDTASSLGYNAFTRLNDNLMLSKKDVFVGPNSRVLASATLESGSQILCGYPFGIVALE